MPRFKSSSDREDETLVLTVLGTGRIVVSGSAWLGVITDFSKDANVLFFELFVVKQGLQCLWPLRPRVVTRSLGQFANDYVLFDLTASPPLSSFHPKDASGRERDRETESSERVVSVPSSHIALIKASQVELVTLTRKACSKLSKTAETS